MLKKHAHLIIALSILIIGPITLTIVLYSLQPTTLKIKPFHKMDILTSGRTITPPPVQILKAPIPLKGDGFGRCLATNGEILVIGAAPFLYDGPKSSYKKTFYVYRYINSSWQLEDTLNFGGAELSVADVLISENRILVAGAPNTLFLFSWEGSRWQRTELKMAEPEYEILFATSIAMDKNIIVAGICKYWRENKVNQICIFEKDKNGWSREIYDSPERYCIDFGRTVAVSGDVVVAGAYRLTYNNIRNSGIVYIYRKSLLGWKMSRLQPSDPEVLGYFGKRVAADGDKIFVKSSGYIYIYTWNGNVYEERKLAQYPKYGYRDLSKLYFDGQRIVVGTSGGEWEGESKDTDGVGIYQLVNGEWHPTMLRRNEPHIYDGFACCIDIADNMLVVGIDKRSLQDDKAQPGEVYIYQLDKLTR